MNPLHSIKLHIFHRKTNISKNKSNIFNKDRILKNNSDIFKNIPIYSTKNQVHWRKFENRKKNDGQLSFIENFSSRKTDY